MVDASGFHTDLNDAQWTIVAPLLPAARPGGRPRTTCVRSVVDAIFYLLRTGCQWRLLPRCFPPWSTVHHYFRAWQCQGVWVRLHRAVYGLARAAAGRSACPSLVIMDGQSAKTTERGGVRGCAGHKLVSGRKRHILVDTLGLIITSSRRASEPTGPARRRPSPRGAAAALSRHPYGDGRCGHQSRELARHLLRHDGWRLRITHRGQRAFRIKRLTWIVERSFAWLGRNRRFSKDYEYQVQTSETLIDIAASRLMLNRIAP